MACGKQNSTNKDKWSQCIYHFAITTDANRDKYWRFNVNDFASDITIFPLDRLHSTSLQYSLPSSEGKRVKNKREHEDDGHDRYRLLAILVLLLHTHKYGNLYTILDHSTHQRHQLFKCVLRLAILLVIRSSSFWSDRVPLITIYQLKIFWYSVNTSLLWQWFLQLPYHWTRYYSYKQDSSIHSTTSFSRTGSCSVFKLWMHWCWYRFFHSCSDLSKLFFWHCNLDVPFLNVLFLNNWPIFWQHSTSEVR